MAGLDIETAVRSNIPIITIILNNGVMTHYDENLPYASKHWGINRLSGNYTKVALGLGAYAERVETPDKLRPSIQRALKETSSGRPAVLEMMTKAEVSVPKTRN
jgi:acetolactate synthase-1/2/3 large subunit